MTAVEAHLADLPADSPAGRAVRWVLDQTARRGEGLTLDEVAKVHESMPDDFDFDQYRSGFGWLADQVGDDFVIDSIDTTDALVTRLRITSANGRTWAWSFTIS